MSVWFKMIDAPKANAMCGVAYVETLFKFSKSSSSAWLPGSLARIKSSSISSSVSRPSKGAWLLAGAPRRSHGLWSQIVVRNCSGVMSGPSRRDKAAWSAIGASSTAGACQETQFATAVLLALGRIALACALTERTPTAGPPHPDHDAVGVGNKIKPPPLCVGGSPKCFPSPADGLPMAKDQVCQLGPTRPCAHVCT